MPKGKTLYRLKYDYLVGHGYFSWEARELSRQYSMGQLRSLPYLHNVTRARGLYIANLRKRGYKDSEIRDRIFALYDTRDWLTNEGVPDVWRMIRHYRKKSIEDSDYVPPKRKGSHHKGGISKGDLQGQKQRRKRKSDLQKYQEGRGHE